MIERVTKSGEPLCLFGDRRSGWTRAGTRRLVEVPGLRGGTAFVAAVEAAEENEEWAKDRHPRSRPAPDSAAGQRRGAFASKYTRTVGRSRGARDAASGP